MPSRGHTHFRHLLLACHLAWQDLFSNKILALCIVSGLASTLLPMLLLAGLKAGLVDHMQQTLLHDPSALEISSARNYPYSEQQLEALRTDKRVTFLLPKTRTLAASVRLQATNTTSVFEGTDAELLPSSPGDPLLGKRIEMRLTKLHAQISSPDIPVVMSAHLAEHMHLQPGDTFVMLIDRHAAGAAKMARIQLNVAAIADETVTSRFQLFVSLPVAQAAEEWRENTNLSSWQEALTLGEQKAADFLKARTPKATWPGFRLYARSLSDVITLDRDLTHQGLSIASELPRVKTILNINQQTTHLFHLMAYIGAIGFAVTLGTAIAAETERKKFHLASLTFLGLNNARIIPVVQTILLATGGTCLAFCIAWGLSWPMNRILHNTFLQDETSASSINITIAFALQLVAYIIPGSTIMAWATTRSLHRVSPWQGICNS